MGYRVCRRGATPMWRCMVQPWSARALIVVKQSPDYLVPATAIILQDQLELKHTTVALDVNWTALPMPSA